MGGGVLLAFSEIYILLRRRKSPDCCLPYFTMVHHLPVTDKVLEYRAPHPLVEHVEPAKDRASCADPEKKSLLSAATKVRHLTPWIGTELVGVQLNRLTAEQKDELALLAAEVSSSMLPSNRTLISTALRGLLPRSRHHSRRAVRADETLRHCEPPPTLVPLPSDFPPARPRPKSARSPTCHHHRPRLVRCSILTQPRC